MEIGIGKEKDENAKKDDIARSWMVKGEGIQRREDVKFFFFIVFIQCG